MQINLRYSMCSKVHLVDPIRGGRAERHKITVERFTDAELAAAQPRNVIRVSKRQVARGSGPRYFLRARLACPFA